MLTKLTLLTINVLENMVRGGWELPKGGATQEEMHQQDLEEALEEARQASNDRSA